MLIDVMFKRVDNSYLAKACVSFGVCLYDVLALIHVWSMP